MRIYIQLADHISEVFDLKIKRHTKDSAFVKIFKELLTQKEVKKALLLGDISKTVKQISEETGQSEQELEEDLKSLAQKGIIYEDKTMDGQASYRLLPFIPGIFESVGALLETSKLTQYLEEYVEEMESVKKEYTKKSIPVNMKVNTEIVSMSIDELMPYLDKAKDFAKMDCICRTVKKERGNPCGHPIKDMCMIFGKFAKYYVTIGAARQATKQEMIHLLYYAEEQGLYHEIYPIEKSKSAFVCNCCTCGCMFMGLANRIKQVTASEYMVSVDQNKCDKCGKCVDFCPGNVFYWDGEKINTNSAQCFQCDGCRLVCAKQAIMR